MTIYFLWWGEGGCVCVCVDNTMKRPWSNDLKARSWHNLGQMQPLTQVRASDVSFHKNCYIGPNMKVRWAEILWFPFTILCLKFFLFQEFFCIYFDPVILNIISNFSNTCILRNSFNTYCFCLKILIQQIQKIVDKVCGKKYDN